MKIVLCLVILGCAAVYADNYLCPEKTGDAFDCFESDKEYRACVKETRSHKPARVVCGKCTRKWEYCRSGNKIEEVDGAEATRQCGADFKSTPCTATNSYWSKTFKLYDDGEQ